MTDIKDQTRFILTLILLKRPNLILFHQRLHKTVLETPFLNMQVPQEIQITDLKYFRLKKHSMVILLRKIPLTLKPVKDTIKKFDFIR